MRVLIVEDDQQIARHLAENLRREGHGVALAADGDEGVKAACESAPGGSFDVLVLDLMLPKLDGFGLLAELRRRGNTTPVLMLSAMASVNDRVRGLRSGADDYLVKPFAFDELLARLQALTRRGVHASAESPPQPITLSCADLHLDRISRRARRGADEIELQPREFALLEYFLCNVGRTLTRSMILEHVWHWKFDPQTNVVDVLVLRLRNKIDRHREHKLIHTLRSVGYVLRHD